MRSLAIGVLAVFVVLFGTSVSVPRASAGGGCRGFPVTAGVGDIVSMDDALCFTPTVLYTHPGEEVTWQNVGTSQPHSVSGANTSWGDYEAVPPGGSITLRFESPGTFSYYCFEHNGMVGTIVVGDGNGDARVAMEGGRREATERRGPRWTIAAAGALTGMVATGVAGVAFGRRRS